MQDTFRSATISISFPATLARIGAGWLASAVLAFATPQVHLIRTPHGGLQPQAAVDQHGTVHLIYYSGDDRAGDIFYVRQKADESSFSKPIRVNSEPGSAIAAGTIRGAQVALGKNGRVHVVWNGSKPAAQGTHEGAPLWYARLTDAGNAFEAQRDLITFAAGLDGGSSVAADSAGNVYVTWHAPAPNAPKGEAGRAVFVARSTDDGRTFGAERQISAQGAGVCPCCGMRAFADQDGMVYVLYRMASDVLKRDAVLLVSRDRGETFSMVHSHAWRIAACPMSSASLAAGPAATLAAWETDGQIHGALVNGKSGSILTTLTPAPGNEKRKHPFATSNVRGEMLLVWTEGTGWQKGGSLAWQIYDRKGAALGESGKQSGVPVWSFASAFAKPNGDFVIVY